MFIGPLVDITYDRMSEIATGVLADETFLEQGGYENALSFLNCGLGLNVPYDTRTSQQMLTVEYYLILNTPIMQKIWVVIWPFLI